MRSTLEMMSCIFCWTSGLELSVVRLRVDKLCQRIMCLLWGTAATRVDNKIMSRKDILLETCVCKLTALKQALSWVYGTVFRKI